MPRTGPTRPVVVTAQGPEIVHVGSACRDVAMDDPRGWRLGGGVAYSALTTARLGVRTAAVVGVDDWARGANEFDVLRDAGVDLMLIRLTEGPVYHNVKTPDGRVQTCMQPGTVLPVPGLPASWIAAKAWMLAPVAGELADAWVAPISAATYVAVAWQGFLRNLTAGVRVTRRSPAASALLGRADLVGVSHHDVAAETPLRDLCGLLRPGAVLAVTQGHEGGLLVTVGMHGPTRTLRWRATRSDGEVDPTGAGDTFLAALLATAVHPNLGGLQRTLLDLRVAAAAGSLVVEGHGLAAVPDRDRVVARLRRDRITRILSPAHAEIAGSYASQDDP